MTPSSDPRAPIVYRMDGRRISSVQDFYREIGRSVNGPGGYFGKNLDALNDCLRGGFGTPPDQSFEFEWQHSDLSRHRLTGIQQGRRSFFAAVAAVFEEAGVAMRLT